MVITFTGRKEEELRLPSRAIITFHTGDTKTLLAKVDHKPVKAWLPFRSLFLIENSDTIVARCLFGGPNVAALVEELSSFGVQDFILWGYCGSISDDVSIGDILAAKGALREDGVSHHYLRSTHDFISTPWFESWQQLASASGIRPAMIWTCDALYRETIRKVSAYRNRGIDAVEMEVASLYAVSLSKNLNSIAFLVVSDQFRQRQWHPGFSKESFRNGAARLRDFLLNHGILRKKAPVTAPSG